ncbi:MAG: hypothetical protein ACXV5Q_04715 [Frankiaceae bacterium]
MLCHVLQGGEITARYRRDAEEAWTGSGPTSSGRCRPATGSWRSAAAGCSARGLPEIFGPTAGGRGRRAQVDIRTRLLTVHPAAAPCGALSGWGSGR